MPPTALETIYVFCQSAQFSSVAQSYLTFFDPVDCSTPGFPVHHNSQSLLKAPVHRVGDVIQPSHPLPLLLLPSIFPSMRAFSNKSVLCIRWPKYWSFSFSISLCNEYSGLISFRIDWFDLLAVQGTLKSLVQHCSSKASILRQSDFFMVQLWFGFFLIRFAILVCTEVSLHLEKDPLAET